MCLSCRAPCPTTSVLHWLHEFNTFVSTITCVRDQNNASICMHSHSSFTLTPTGISACLIRVFNIHSLLALMVYLFLVFWWWGKKLLQQVPYTHSRGRSLCNVSECSHGGVLHLFRFFVCSNPAKCDFSFFFVYGAQSILISTSAIQVYFFCYRFWLFLVVVLFALLLLFLLWECVLFGCSCWTFLWMNKKEKVVVLPIECRLLLAGWLTDGYYCCCCLKRVCFRSN